MQRSRVATEGLSRKPFAQEMIVDGLSGVTTLIDLTFAGRGLAPLEEAYSCCQEVAIFLAGPRKRSRACGGPVEDNHSLSLVAKVPTNQPSPYVW